jgi:hypothetical protein
VNQDADDLAVTDHLVEVIFDGLLAQIIGPLLAGFGESLLLARIPVGEYPCISKEKNGRRPLRHHTTMMPIGDYCSPPWSPLIIQMMELT